MDIPITLFLDTNVFESAKYIFSDNRFLRLKWLVDCEIVCVKIPDVVDGEIKRHISLAVGNSRNALRKALRTALDKQGYESHFSLEQTLRMFNGSDVISMFSFAEKSNDAEFLDRALANYTDFKTHINAEGIKSSNIDIPSILSDYFSVQPPFETCKDKRNEFPDAFMMAKIKECATSGKPVCVVSYDNVFKTLEDVPGIRVFSTLPDLYEFIKVECKDVYNHQIYDFWAERATEYLSVGTVNQQVCKQIQDCIMDMNPFVDGYECDHHGVIEGYDYDETDIYTPPTVSFEFELVDSVEETILLATLSCKADIEARCVYLDANNSYWDKEEDKYLWVSYGCVLEHHHVDFLATISFEISDDAIKSHAPPTSKLSLINTPDRSERNCRLMIGQY